MGTSIARAADTKPTGGLASQFAPLVVAFAGRTDIGQRRRRNEDAFLMVPDLRLAVVADGMGGRPCGDFASETATLTLAEAVGSGPAKRDPRLSQLSEDERNLVEAMHSANRMVYDRGQILAGTEGSMGTTAVATMFSEDGRTISIVHVGDSRCYRVREGEIVQLTRDHSLVNELSERAPWLDAEAIATMPKNVLTRALGLKREVTVDLLSDSTEPADVYLLCSDGLWGSVNAEEIAEIVSLSPSLDDACARLVERANENGGGDNITAVLVQLERAETRHVSGLTLRTVREDMDHVEPDLDWDR